MNYYATFIVCLLLQITGIKSLSAGNEVIPTGSYIIDMGVSPQTYSTGLKPYGLIHTLIKDYQIPIKWSINPAKVKDGIDFTYNGQDFKGGPFIITANYRTTTIDSVVNSWMSQGVVIVTTTSTVTVPIYNTITYFTTWILDAQNGKIAEQFLIHANIPATSYSFIDPSQLTCCHDLYVMPHADPTWTTHQNLLYWNANNSAGGCDGAIWAGCHAVSVLENLYNSSNPVERMSFLMNDPISGTESAVPYGSHNNGTLPYLYRFSGHPVMQFMGSLDAATTNGSEQIYLPRANGWRPTTSIAVYDPTQSNVPSLSPGEAAVLAFGVGKGDSTRGRVLFMGGHDIGKSAAIANVAAERSFFNFSLWAAETKAIHVTSFIPKVMSSGTSYTVAVTSTGGAGGYTYNWSSSCAGTFSNSTVSSTTFTPTVVNVVTTCNITCLVKDYCGTRLGFETVTITITPPPPIVSNITANATEVCVGGSSTLSVTVSGGAGTTTYQWQSSPDNSTWGNINGANTASYTTTILTADTYFRVLVMQTGCNCTVTSNSALVTVVSTPSVSIVSTSSNICKGGNILLTSMSTGGTGTCTTQWQQSINNGVSWSNIVGATNVTYSVSNAVISTRYRAVYSCSGSGCCN